jgi:hypothetical protein
MKTPTTDYSNADNFYKPILSGKTSTVDIDFRKDGASSGCNLNYHLVDIPVWNQERTRSNRDAQCFRDMRCGSEFNMNERNTNVQQITNHARTVDYAADLDWACDER